MLPQAIKFTPPLTLESSTSPAQIAEESFAELKANFFLTEKSDQRKLLLWQ